MKNILFLFVLALTSFAFAQPNINQPDDIIVYEFPFDGFATFDLTINVSQTLNGIDPTTVTVTYYETLADAQTQSFPIATPTNWSNIANPQTFYVNVVDNSSNLFSTTSFSVEVLEDVVNIPDANFLARLITIGVDTNSSGNIQFSEAEAVTNLSLNQANISDLTGIEAFVNLVTLNFSINNVNGNLDFSANTSLETIVCFSNQISTVNLTNNTSLKVLEAWANPLLDLDVSNNILLEALGVSGSQIESLDLNNNVNLLDLSIASNQFLETVFIKNGSDESTNIDSGSWSENWGFGNNPSLQYVCADADQVAEIQGLSQGAYVVNSFCDFQPGGDYNTITGVAQFDINNDGCDVSDPFIPNLNIELGNGPATLVPGVISDSIGVYNLYVAQAGNYTVQPYLENPSYFNINPNFPSVNIPFIDNGTTTQDFCLTANGVFADAEVVIAPIFPSRPGFDATYKLVYKNKGNQVLSGSVTFQYDDTVLDFLSSTETPDAQSTGVLTYNFTDLLPFESQAVEITLNVNGPTETPAINIDDVLDYTSTISIDQTEETPDDNTFDYSEVVVGAYDPNDITCLQGDLVPDSLIGEFLNYMIRFENTGNAPAENVVITTDISASDFSLNTLKVLDASHDMYMQINDGVIEFVFENIQLDGGGGHGNILLKIKTRPDLTTTDEVDAQADIYFDFNFPIETNIANTAFGVLSTTPFETEQNVKIYPNPSAGELNIEALSQIQNVTIYDIQGREVSSQNNSENTMNLKLDVSNLSRGIYIIKIETSRGQMSQKLIKE
jgi:uncharacterized repeat protein (TIGR01451 family)